MRDLELEGYKSIGSTTIALEDKPVICKSHSLDDLSSEYPEYTELDLKERLGLSSDDGTVRVYPFQR